MKLAAEMSAGTRFRNSLGARPIVFTTNRRPLANGIPDLSGPVRNPAPTDRSVAGLAA